MIPFKTEQDAQKRIEKLSAESDGYTFHIIKPHNNLRRKGFIIEEHDIHGGFMRSIGSEL